MLDKNELRNQIMTIPEKRKYWLVRAGVESIYSDDFQQGKFIALGWDRINSFLITTDLIKFKEDIEKLYPEIEERDEKNYKRKISEIATKLFRFYNELKIGDMVITPTNDGHVLIGEIASEVEILNSGIMPIFNEKDKYGDLIGSLNKERKVRWLRKIERKDLEPNLKNYIRIYQGISHIKDRQVITEINRTLFNIYIENNKSHIIFYINEKNDIDGFKYACFVEKMTKLIKVAEQYSGEKIKFSIKTNVQSPGPFEIIIPNPILNLILLGSNAIFRKDEKALAKIEVPEIRKEVEKLAKDVEYEYNDYDFPCSGDY